VSSAVEGSRIWLLLLLLQLFVLQPSTPPKKRVIPTEAAHGSIVSGAVEGSPHFARSCNTLTMPEQAYVYIMASSFQHLYIGITTKIETRAAQHKSGYYPDSFTSRNKIDKLVYFERFARIPEAIAREKQLKKWSRIKKIRLIVAQNPTWQDLSAEWASQFNLTKKF
jgi:putative endonuclease